MSGHRAEKRSRSSVDPTGKDIKAIADAEKTKFMELLEGNKKFMASQSAEYFKQMGSNPQTPSYLYIGCSDSRVPIELVTNQDPGAVFVHRNIANLVVPNDLNLLSVLEYSVGHLNVNHIVVCGHYGCGGVKAAMGSTDLGLLEHWLRNIRDVSRLHNEELLAIRDDEKRYNRLVELSVQESCINLFKTSVVQAAHKKRQMPHIHGLVYDMCTGELKKLDIDFDREFCRKYEHLYKLDKRRREKKALPVRDAEGFGLQWRTILPASHPITPGDHSAMQLATTTGENRWPLEGKPPGEGCRVQ